MEEKNEKKSASNCKRSRPEWGKNDDDESPVCLQTPHTLRLLKLIEEGTLEHARIAASHLASLNASPIVLWDLLGRLQAFLCSPQWSTRLHASLAMQGVAQRIPPSDQRDFLEATYSGPLWLTVEEVSHGLDTILSEGRILLSECDTKEDSFASQEDLLKRLDENREELQEDFVEHRVRLQRQILAQRLGLGGVVQAVGGAVLSDVITKEDLLMDGDTSKYEAKSQNRVKRQRLNEKEDESGSIRALLVMEMQQQQDEGQGAATSHKNPQTLLATELIFRMFDPSWYVRHGAFLGTLSLLRAWKGVVGHHAFGMWPHDIMARCLCVLSLDRFGDYGGAGLGEYSGGGDRVVAPVREMAGQLLSVLWSMAPETIQKRCLKVLIRLSTRDEWEVRHGVLLALKYIVVLQSANVLKDMSEESSIATLAEVSRVAKNSLSDEMEDVQGVAAQVLLGILNSSRGKESQQKELILASCVHLWNALGRLRSSSCAVDFVGLFSGMICTDCSLVCSELASTRGEDVTVMGTIAEKLVDFLDYDTAAVNISALKAIGSIAASFAVEAKDCLEQDISESLVRSYCSVLERVFLSYTIGHYVMPPHEDDNDARTRYEYLCSARNATWATLVAHAGPVLQQSPKQCKNLLVRLMLIYVKIQHHSASQGAAVLNPSSADALSRLLVRVNDANESTVDTLDSFLKRTFGLLLNSPWKEHCERACILYQALMSNGYPLLRVRQSHALFQQLLQETPPCLSPKLEHLASAILLKPLVTETVNGALDSALTTALADRDVANKLDRETFWHTTLKSKGFVVPILENNSDPVPANTSSMRIYSMIAGAIVSGGHEHFPPRLTPLVRALMTSLKSERMRERQVLTYQSLALLLNSLSNSLDESRLRVRNKVVENICALLSTDNTSPDMQGDDTSQPASQIIALIVSHLPNDKTLTYIPPLWDRLRLIVGGYQSFANDKSLDENLRLLSVVSKALKQETAATSHVVANLIGPLVPIACTYKISGTRATAIGIVVSLCQTNPDLAMDTSLPLILSFVEDKGNDSRRLGSLRLLQSIIEGVGIDICPFVRCLLPVAMSLMTDPLEDCAKQAAQSFATLVRVSPLVKGTKRRQWERKSGEEQSEKVIDHLIHGKPLPPCILPDLIMEELNEAGISLRDYQMEGIAWLRFLQQVRLNGILAGTLFDVVGGRKRFQRY